MNARLQNTHVYTLTDFFDREYEAFIREEIEERHYSPEVVIHTTVFRVDAVKYRGKEVKRFNEQAVLNDLELKIDLSTINLPDYL